MSTVADKTKQLVALRGAAIDAARARMNLRIVDLARISTVGYGSVCRALKGDSIGVDLAEKIAAALGVTVGELQAAESDRRPAEGYSAPMMAHFQRLLSARLETLIAECHRETGEEARRRCLFWPALTKIRQTITLQQRTASGEVVL